MKPILTKQIIRINQKYLLVIGFMFFIKFAYPQTSTPKIHAHNDYQNGAPFWEAYFNNADSIEIDVFLDHGNLYVAHEKANINPAWTIENLYLNALQEAFKNFGEKKLILLIDIKSEPYETLKALIKVLNRYAYITAKKSLVTVVISGNRPKPEEYSKYPDFMYFDCQELESIRINPDKVFMVSFSLSAFCNWNGKGRLTDLDLKKLTELISKVHQAQKPIRFWNSPDTKTAWKTLIDIGVDYISTDSPSEASKYIQGLKHTDYTAKAFSEVYTPTFKSDGTQNKIEHIILLIGDGMGLSQISAATMANRGTLSLTQLKTVGLVKTSSADSYITDSAAGATAYATGQKAKNRMVGIAAGGVVSENLIVRLDKKGFKSGIITTDNITGATPASFYARREDRSMEEDILHDLVDSKLTLFASLENDLFFQNYSSIVSALEKKHFTILKSTDSPAPLQDEKLAYIEAADPLRDFEKSFLPRMTQKSLAFLEAKHHPFFLLVEGAHIDTFAHFNETKGIITQIIDFDRAISQALRFADKNENTLVIVTADHETGGFSTLQGDIQTHYTQGAFSTNDHTGTMVPIFAYGPYSQLFNGTYENTEVFQKIIDAVEASTKASPKNKPIIRANYSD